MTSDGILHINFFKQTAVDDGDKVDNSTSELPTLPTCTHSPTTSFLCVLTPIGIHDLNTSSTDHPSMTPRH